MPTIKLIKLYNKILFFQGLPFVFDKKFDSKATFFGDLIKTLKMQVDEYGFDNIYDFEPVNHC